MRIANLVLLCAACATGRSAGGEWIGADEAATFRVFYPDQPPDGFTAKVGKRFFIKPVAACRYDNGRDARWAMTSARLDAGELPAGFTIEDGAIAGTPKAPGTWSVKIKFSGVTCAGKPRDPVVVGVIITAR
jgi:hypothetical protein